MEKGLIRDSDGLSKEIHKLLKERIREYTAKETLLYKILMQNGRVLNTTDYDMNSYYNFKIFLLELLNKNNLTCSLTDKNIVYIMINQALKEPTLVFSMDRDIGDLCSRIIENLTELNKRLKKYDLKINKKIDVNRLNTNVIRAFVTCY